MKSKPIPQLGAALALVELVKEANTAGLPRLAWQVGEFLDALDGNLHGHPLETLEAYAELLGGTVERRHEYKFEGRRFLSYGVSVVWRDVEVLLTTGVPIEDRLAVAA